jgi:hypothetical protein
MHRTQLLVVIGAVIGMYNGVPNGTPGAAQGYELEGCRKLEPFCHSS